MIQNAADIDIHRKLRIYNSLKIFYLLTLILGLSALPAHAQYAGGNGDPNNPFLIADPNHLNAVGLHPEHWSKHFKLTAHLDLSRFTGADFNIIGHQYKSFSGLFDGNDCTISNFSYTTTGANYIALFGYIDGENAAIKNLTMVNPQINAGDGCYVAPLVGFLQSGSIINCAVGAGSVDGYFEIGGLAGRNNQGDITHSHSCCIVTALNIAGGLVGKNSGAITACSAQGSVTANAGFDNIALGGLAGTNSGAISACYASGNVYGTGYWVEVGGLVGSNFGDIINCYATGSAYGYSGWDLVAAAGLVAMNQGRIYTCYSLGISSSGLVASNFDYQYGVVWCSFWDNQLGSSHSGGGAGKTTAQMKSADTYQNWGFDQIWTIDQGNDYPHLAWENQPGILISTPLPTYGGGSGDSTHPFKICSASQLNTIGACRQHWDKHFALMNDVDLGSFSGADFNLIGYPFTGVFEGGGFTISNFTYDRIGHDYTALFPIVQGPDAAIRNVHLTNPVVDAGMEYYHSRYAAALVGHLILATVSNCSAHGGRVEGSDEVGGLVGSSESGRIIESCAATLVEGSDMHIGGLVGENVSGLVQSCYASGNVDGRRLVGGLVGYNRLGEILNCYACGNVAGSYKWPGGLVGHNWQGHINNCYAVGAVTGGAELGGLVGENYQGVIFLSYWDTQTSGLADSDGGAGKTTVQMKSADTFKYWGYDAAWTIDDGIDYPHLVWENKPGQLIDRPLPTYGGGDGSDLQPYKIYTADQLNEIGVCKIHWDKHFLLMNDIDLGGFTGADFNRIGWPFTGAFDGGGHVISQFNYASHSDAYVALFAMVEGPHAQISNLHLSDPCVIDEDAEYVASLIGKLNAARVENCQVTGGFVKGESYVGGLVGYSTEGTITNCRAETRVKGDNQVAGGLVAGMYYGTMEDCYADCVVAGHQNVGSLLGSIRESHVYHSQAHGCVTGKKNVAGLIGCYYDYEQDGLVHRCYADCTVTGVSRVGGLVGDCLGKVTESFAGGAVYGGNEVGGLVGTNFEIIENCYARARVDGNDKIGGLLGYQYHSGQIKNCYAAGRVTGQNDVGGFVGHHGQGAYLKNYWDQTVNSDLTGIGNTSSPNVIAETTENLQNSTTFESAGWDFVGEEENGAQDLWDICDKMNYPKLAWQTPITADFGCPDGVDLLDLAYWAGYWLKSGCRESNNYCQKTDINKSGQVDIFDYQLLAKNWMIGR